MKKILALVMALCMILSLGASLAEGITTLEEGKFLYSTSPDFPPFEFRDDQDNVVGIEPELIALICEKIGLEAVPVPMDFDGALMAARVDQGGAKVDAVVSGVTIREDRKLLFDFSIPYTTITQAIVSKDGAVTQDMLADKAIGVQAGTTGFIYADDNFKNVTSYGTYSLAFQALQNGQIDCIVLDDVVGNAYIKQYAGLGIQPTDLDPESFGFGINKGNTALLDAVNAALQELIDDGTVESIILKYNE